MINNISEGPLRAAMKIDPTGAIHDKQTAREKAEALRQARPVEDTESGNRAKPQDQNDESSSKYLVEDKMIVFEKYNKDGDLVYRIPPSYKPVDERA